MSSKTVWQCENCEGDNVEVKTFCWINPNLTNDAWNHALIADSEGDDDSMPWCHDCEKHVSLIEKEVTVA